MIYFTSDLHFGHDKPFLYEPRGFKNIEEHDEAIITGWNNLIAPDDEVYILGDLVMGDSNAGIENLNRLKGKLYFIIGNHDTDKKIALYTSNANRGIINLGYADMFKQGKFNALMSHRPTMMGNFDEPLYTWCLHGHTHSSDRFQYLQYGCYNVALDAHNNLPVSIEEIRADIRAQKEIKRTEIITE